MYMSVSSSCFLCIIHPLLFPAPFPRLSYPVYPDFPLLFILYLFASSLPLFCCLRPGSLSQWAIFKDDSIPRMHLEESETGREVSLIAEVWARMNKCVHASEVQGTKMPGEEKNWLCTNWKIKRKVSVLVGLGKDTPILKHDQWSCSSTQLQRGLV